MAYDPKSYLDQALKTGFESIYSQPSSLETGEAPQYQGDVATFDNVQVRPLSEAVYEGTGDAQNQTGSKQTGYMVSKPLTGQYEGYFLNHLYDNEGNFTGTSISEPDDDKYGLKSLAQLGLTAASFGGLGPIASAAANAYKGVQALKSGDVLSAAASILPGLGQIPGVSSELAGTLKTVGGYAKTGSALQKAIENKDILGLLEATSGIPGAPKVPTELTDILKGAGQANRLREAISSGNPEALFREVVGLSKSGVPFSKLADVTGENAIEGFFAPGGEGYDATQEDLDSILARYTGSDTPAADTSTTTTFTPGSDDVYEDIESLLARYEDQGFADQPSGPTDQSIDITGSQDVIIPDWDVLPDAVTTPRSIRDVGPVTTISPGEKLEGTEIKEPDLAAGLKPATTGGTKTTTKTTTDKKNEIDWAKLFALLGSMQRPQEQKEQYQLANMPDYEDLMYGLSSGETPYMRG